MRDGETAIDPFIRVRRENSRRAAIIEWLGVNLKRHDDPFHSFDGSAAVRMALAAKIVEAHGGQTAHHLNTLTVWLPLTGQRDAVAAGT